MYVKIPGSQPSQVQHYQECPRMSWESEHFGVTQNVQESVFRCLLSFNSTFVLVWIKLFNVGYWYYTSLFSWHSNHPFNIQHIKYWIEVTTSMFKKNCVYIIVNIYLVSICKRFVRISLLGISSINFFNIHFLPKFQDYQYSICGKTRGD